MPEDKWHNTSKIYLMPELGRQAQEAEWDTGFAVTYAIFCFACRAYLCHTSKLYGEGLLGRHADYPASYHSVLKPWIEVDNFQVELADSLYSFEEMAAIFDIPPGNARHIKFFLRKCREDIGSYEQYRVELFDVLDFQSEPDPWWRVLTANRTDPYTEHEQFNYQMGDDKDYSSERIGKYVHPKGRSPYKGKKGRHDPKTGHLLPKEKWGSG